MPLIETFLLLGIIIYLLYGYSDRSRTSLFVQVIVFIGWFISFSIIIIIPLDVYLSCHLDQEKRIFGNIDAFEEWWFISYWATNFINWLVTPLIMGYIIAGEFTASEKIYRSFVINIPYYILYFFSFAGLLGICFWIDESNDDPTIPKLLEGPNSIGIFGIAIALSLAFGYFTLVTLLGYALVMIPKKLW